MGESCWLFQQQHHVSVFTWHRVALRQQLTEDHHFLQGLLLFVQPVFRHYVEISATSTQCTITNVEPPAFIATSLIVMAAFCQLVLIVSIFAKLPIEMSDKVFMPPYYSTNGIAPAILAAMIQTFISSGISE